MHHSFATSVSDIFERLLQAPRPDLPYFHTFLLLSIVPLSASFTMDMLLELVKD